MLVRCIGTIGSGGIHHPPGTLLDLPAVEIPRLVALGVAEVVEVQVTPPPPAPQEDVTTPLAGNGVTRDGERAPEPAVLLPAVPVPNLEPPPDAPASAPSAPEPAPVKKEKKRRQR